MELLSDLPQAAFQDLVVKSFKVLAEEETEEALSGMFMFPTVAHPRPCGQAAPADSHCTAQGGRHLLVRALGFRFCGRSLTLVRPAWSTFCFMRPVCTPPHISADSIGEPSGCRSFCVEAGLCCSHFVYCGSRQVGCRRRQHRVSEGGGLLSGPWCGGGDANANGRVARIASNISRTTSDPQCCFLCLS